MTVSDPTDVPHMLLAEAMERFLDHGDTSLLPQAARAMVLAAGEELGGKALERRDVPAAFSDRVICAETTYESAPDVAKAMGASMIQDPLFEAQSRTFQARTWELFACCWRKEFEQTRDERAADGTIDAFQRAVDIGETCKSPRVPILLHGLANSLFERGRRTESAADLSRAAAALRRGSAVCGDDLRMKSVFVASFVDLAEVIQHDDDFTDVLICLETAARDDRFDPQYRNDIRLKLSRFAVEKALSRRSVQLADRIEGILTTAFADLPKLDRYAQVLQDDAARVRGWRESLRPLEATDKS
jgi:hypothetical protein